MMKKVLVTGASGFLGRATVLALLKAGHQVTAMVRPVSKGGFDEHENLSIIRGDLRQLGEWADEVGFHDVVIHGAALTSGDLAEQIATTVVGTANLFDALKASPVTRLVHISSFSVYDYEAAVSKNLLTEETPLERRTSDRDAYTEVKLYQEQMARDFTRDQSIDLVVIRPGAIIGPDRLWDYGLGRASKHVGIVFGSDSRFRLTYIENCADAIALSVTAPCAGSITVNVIDSDLPTYAEYYEMCRSAGADVPRRIVPIPFAVMRALVWPLEAVNKLKFSSTLRLPESMHRFRQQARWSDIECPNDGARRLLGWTPKFSAREAVVASLAIELNATSKRLR